MLCGGGSGSNLGDDGAMAIAVYLTALTALTILDVRRAIPELHFSLILKHTSRVQTHRIYLHQYRPVERLQRGTVPVYTGVMVASADESPCGGYIRRSIGGINAIFIRIFLFDISADLVKMVFFFYIINIVNLLLSLYFNF